LIKCKEYNVVKQMSKKQQNHRDVQGLFFESVCPAGVAKSIPKRLVRGGWFCGCCGGMLRAFALCLDVDFAPRGFVFLAFGEGDVEESVVERGRDSFHFDARW